MNGKLSSVMCRNKIILLLFSVFFFSISNVALAQSKQTINGIVSGEGEVLIGASVKEINTSNAAITDFDGKFTLSVNSGAILEISYLGFKTKSVKIGNQTSLLIELDADVSVLDEVVAIGYGVQQKKLITGATVQVKGDDIAKLNTVSAVGALQSQTPGVNITKTSGKPGDGFKVTIRGLGTIQNSNPLYIIDGVPNDNMDMLNPSDIEAVDVLKDAASAAIYGARAANGVILITTKQGSKGKASIQYDGYVGWQSVAKKVKALNADQYLTLMNEAGYDRDYFKSAFTSNGYTDLWNSIENGSFTGTNWLDEMIQNNAPIQNHALNISTGSDISTFSLGLSYTSQEPIIGPNAVDSEFERFTIRLNSTHNLVKHKDFTLLEFGQNLLINHTNRSGLGMGTGSIYWNDVRNALNASPLYSVYYDDVNYDYTIPVQSIDPDAANPIAEMHYKRSNVSSKNYSARGNFYLTLQPIKNLKFKTSFGYSYNGWSSREYLPVYYLNNKDKQETDRTTQGSGNGLQWSWDNTIAYDFNIDQDNKVSALLGSSVEKWGLGEDMNGIKLNSQFTSFEYAYLSNSDEVVSLTGAPWKEGGIASFFGRVNYDHKGKYMATAIIRADGSSNFAKGNRWGYFPSFSAGWNIAEENFMADTRSFLDQLKLRASWGENGNCNIPPFLYNGSIAIGNMYNAAWYYFGDSKGQASIGLYPDIVPNPDLTWETSRQTNIGIDSRFIGGKLGFSFDWYNKKTIDWLVNPPLPGIIGTGYPWVNGGDVKNTGIEMSLDWNDKIGDFTYGARFNLTHNKNKVTKIANGSGIVEATEGDVLGHNTGKFYRAEVGKPLGYFYGYKSAGIFQNDEQIQAYVHPETGLPIMPNAQPGDVIFLDLNNNGAIDEEDKTEIGNPHPDFTYGMTLNFGYKGFDLSVTGYGVGGNQIAKAYRSYGNKTFQNYTEEMMGRWHGEGTSNRLPKIGGTSTNWQVSDLYIEDGDYFRITNLTLGYDFKKLLKSVPLAQMRLYATVQNLYTFTNYSGMDPEIGYNAGDSWASGIDLGFYPSARTYMIGVSIKY